MPKSRGAWAGVLVAMLAAAAAVTASRLAPAEQEPSEIGADELFDRGVEALRAKRHADAASLFRLSYGMKRRAATQCNLALTYEEWGGHDREALEAYRRCAAEDDSGRFMAQALEKAQAIEARLGGGAAPAEPSPPRVAGGARVTWGQVEATPSCAFFSGPGELGQDDRLGDAADVGPSGAGLALTFAGGPTFEGQRIGRLISFGRRSVHARGGAQWVVEEAIGGLLEDEVFDGVYHYQECDPRQPASCPGPCSIRAEVQVRIDAAAP
jgi:hypothetical protein